MARDKKRQIKEVNAMITLSNLRLEQNHCENQISENFSGGGGLDKASSRHLLR